MELANYEAISKDNIAPLVQSRFADEIQQMRLLGFKEEFYIREKGFALSLLVFSPYIALDYFRGRIVFRVEGLLRAVFYKPYLIHEDGYVYVDVGKARIEFVTLFNNGLLLQTATAKPEYPRKPDRRSITQMPHPGDIVLTWEAHVETVKFFVGEGHRAISPLRMKDIVRFEMYALMLFVGGAVDFDDIFPIKKTY